MGGVGGREKEGGKERGVNIGEPCNKAGSFHGDGCSGFPILDGGEGIAEELFAI